MVNPRAESHVRLKEAVRRNRAFSREGLLERLFERRKRLPDLIRACREARSNPFPGWK